MPWLGTSFAASGSVQSQMMRSAGSSTLPFHEDGSAASYVLSGEGRKSAHSLAATALKNLASVSVNAPELK